MSVPFDNREFRRALGQFATGVTIVTTRETDGTPRGFTANSFTSVSLDPPLLLVCIAHAAASRAVFCAAPSFAVNILAEEQKEVSGLFATQRPDKFQVADWRPGPGGMPLIDGALAWFECARFDEKPAGDHVIVIGRVTDFGYREGQPLGYLRGSYFTLGLEAALADAAAKGATTVIGAIYENDGALLFEQDEATGALSLPAVGRDGKPASLARLTGRWNGTALETSIDFVYAVFEDRRAGTLSIYYRGQVAGQPPAGTAFVPLDEIPWERIADPSCRQMLQRYASEALQGHFAIYMGSEDRGIVRPVG